MILKSTTIWFYPLAIMGILLLLASGCKKEDTKKNETITDIDGNVYHTVIIGTQTWMLENLKVTRYRNGDTIPNITENKVWQNFTEGACCDYNNSATVSTIYGKLYNYYTFLDSRKICPVGWHVPSDDEWTTLTTFLGSQGAGNELKEADTIHWQSPNNGATNRTGFTAIPGGLRDYDGSFTYIGKEGLWWSSTKRDGFWYWFRVMLYDYSGVSRGSGLPGGLSIRCIKDEIQIK